MGTNFKFLDSDKSAKSMDSGNKSFLLLVMGCQAVTLEICFHAHPLYSSVVTSVRTLMWSVFLTIVPF